MEKLSFIFSKQVLVVLSGLVFTGVAFVSSDAGTILGDHTLKSLETKVPEVQKIEETLGSSASDQNQAPTIIQPAPKKIANTATLSTPTPTQSSRNPNAIVLTPTASSQITTGLNIRSLATSPYPSITKVPEKEIEDNKESEIENERMEELSRSLQEAKSPEKD